MTVVFVDGWFGPDPGDWQELWGLDLAGSRRVVQDDWDTPQRELWVERLDEVLAESSSPVLVAHSLGTLTVAHWVAGGGRRPVKGALLVTPADVERNPDPAIRGFAPIPRSAFPFPTIVAASRTDRWMTPERAQEFADAWGAKLVDVGPVGHLTVAEGPGSLACRSGALGGVALGDQGELLRGRL
ncbi:alpha/beta hydrolase [Saccharothrix sp.]|uniref:RBBP9/YdeN family alpha/beta hydrolase n=1 Tax=Saccharothrix sp. TaxID=1873460 RepID=UPI0028120E45|nr:alpha/beta hydrolase [Saccharothrix sp.]